MREAASDPITVSKTVNGGKVKSEDGPIMIKGYKNLKFKYGHELQITFINTCKMWKKQIHKS